MPSMGYLRAVDGITIGSMSSCSSGGMLVDSFPVTENQHLFETEALQQQQQQQRRYLDLSEPSALRSVHLSTFHNFYYTFSSFLFPPPPLFLKLLFHQWPLDGSVSLTGVILLSVHAWRSVFVWDTQSMVSQDIAFFPVCSISHRCLVS